MRAERESSEHIRELLARQMEVRGWRVLLALARLQRLMLKAGFRESQPRWPKGSGDISGEWRDEGRRQQGARVAAIEVNIFGEPPPDDPKTPPKEPRLRIPVPDGEGSGEPPPPEDPPPLPDKPPATVKARNQLVKRVVKWIAGALARRAPAHIRVFVDAIKAVNWLADHYPEIQSYFDAPKSLDELRHSVDQPGEGYEIHHIVEKDSAAKDGFSWSRINGRDNLVRVPKLKHHQITGWFMKINKDFGYRSPRDYLRGRSWAERTKIGLDALRVYGVLR
jgi:hypothetical protein